MIAYLRGEIKELDFQSLTILTPSGVGYELFINELIYAQLALEQDVEMYVYHHITENAQSLFGFISLEDKKVFSELIKISGVGGKVAMQILSLGIHRLVQAVAMQDNKTIESIKGIGKKMAEKIILELKDKDFGIQVDAENQKQSNSVQIDRDLYQSIKETLTNMGYNLKDVERVLQDLPEGIEGAGDIIPYVIKQLS